MLTNDLRNFHGQYGRFPAKGTNELSDFIKSSKLSNAPKVYSPLEKKLAERTAGALDDYRQSADKARSLNALLQPAAMSDLYTGAFGESAQFLRKIGAIFGYNTKEAAEGELIKNAQSQMAMIMRNPAGGGGLPGAASEKDVEFLLSSVAGLSNTVEGRKLIAEIMMATNNYKIEMADEANAAMTTALNEGKDFNIYQFKPTVTSSAKRVKELILRARELHANQSKTPTNPPPPRVEVQTTTKYDALSDENKAKVDGYLSNNGAK